MKESASTVGSLTSYQMAEQSTEGEEVYQFSGARRCEGEGCWDLQLAGARGITLFGITL